MKLTIYSVGATLVVAATVRAAEKAPVEAPAGKELFEYEKLQLTEDNLNTLKGPERAWFDFGKGQPEQGIGDHHCKPLPGDSHYPNQTVWDRVLGVGGRKVIMSVPQASCCYAGDKYDPSECKYLGDNWGDPYLQ